MLQRGRYLLSCVVVFCRVLKLIRYSKVDFMFGPPGLCSLYRGIRYIEVRYIEVLFHTFYFNFGQEIVRYIKEFIV